jgi:hypothetical protein
MQETIQTASSSGISMQGANREPVEVLGLETIPKLSETLQKKPRKLWQIRMVPGA